VRRHSRSAGYASAIASRVVTVLQLRAVALTPSERLARRAHRRDLFSRHALRRAAALSYLRSRPTVETARLLREYVVWEPAASSSRSRKLTW